MASTVRLPADASAGDMSRNAVVGARDPVAMAEQRTFAAPSPYDAACNSDCPMSGKDVQASLHQHGIHAQLSDTTLRLQPSAHTWDASCHGMR